MNGIGAVGVALLITFLFGIFLGIVVIASISFNRDPLKGTPPDSASGGTRWLVGMSRRDHQPGPSSGDAQPGPAGSAEPDDRDDYPWWPSQR